MATVAPFLMVAELLASFTTATWIVQVAFLPLADFTVMTALPAFFAVTCPLLLTVATRLLELFQVSLSDAFAGVRFTLRVAFVPLLSVSFFFWMPSFLVATTFLTFTWHFTWMPLPDLTVITALPAFTAVIFPLAFTFATFVLLLV